MYSNPDLSVCVATGGGESELPRFVSAVLNNDDYLRREVVVVNQHLSRSFLTEQLGEHAEVEIIDCPPGLSRPGAFNLALEKCGGRYISFWDQASLPAPGCLLLLTEFMDENPEAGLAVPKLRDARGIIQPVARSLPGIFSFLYPVGLPGKISPGWSDYSSGEASWLTGPGLTVNRYMLEEVGGLAAKLPTLWPLDLCLRALKAGWHCCYRHDAQAAADIRQWLEGLDNPGRQLWERLMVSLTRLRFIY